MTSLGPELPLTLPLPIEQLREIAWFHVLLNYAPVKALLPVVIFLVIAPIIGRIARRTWAEIQAEAAIDREAAGSQALDYRPAVCLVITASMLTLQEYYGGRAFFEEIVKPELSELYQGGYSFLRFSKYKELYAHAWWVTARVLGYVCVPLIFWKIFFPSDRLIDMGLRATGFVKHLWLYGVCLAIVIPAMLVVAQQPDFGGYYPFYKLSSRSWFDFLAWETIYCVQFFALELFFRGWIVAVLRRSMGWVAIFVMTVPYCMIHYGKPYFEAHGAVIAGVVLGTLALKTRSIYGGFLLHITVAFSMDFLSLYKRAALPKTFWVGG